MNPTELRTLKEIKAELGQAKIKHYLFKTNLRSYLYGSGTNRHTLTDPTACALAHWLDRMSNKYHLSLELEEVRYYHNKVHEVAHRLVEMYDRGEIEEARNAYEDVDKVSNQLLESLFKLERMLLEAD